MNINDTKNLPTLEDEFECLVVNFPQFKKGEKSYDMLRNFFFSGAVACHSLSIRAAMLPEGESVEEMQKIEKQIAEYGISLLKGLFESFEKKEYVQRN